MYLGVILSRHTACGKDAIEDSYLNRKNVIQNQKYKRKNNIQLFNLI
jgi:hypothetical protein